MIVSHKPFFLDQAANTTWELTPTGLQVYGSNYFIYREQKQREHLWVEHRLLLKDIRLHVESGDRIAIAGMNTLGDFS